MRLRRPSAVLASKRRTPQDLLHESLGLWARDHASRYPDIAVVEYDPDARPEQRIDAFKTPVSIALGSMPPDVLIESLRKGYAKTLGSVSLAAIETVADALGDRAKQFLIDRRSIAILVGHADQLHDIGVLCGAVAIFLGSAEGVGRNGTILNKAMTRESFRSTPIADLFASFGNVYWVIPESASASRWRVPPEVANYVNTGAMRSMMTDMRKGIVLTFAPSGSAMRQEFSNDGTLKSLVIPSVGSATVNLISRFDAVVVAATWQNQIRVSPLTPLPPPPRGDRSTRDRERRKILASIMDRMASMTAELAGVPVRYES